MGYLRCLQPYISCPFLPYDTVSSPSALSGRQKQSTLNTPPSVSCAAGAMTTFCVITTFCIAAGSRIPSAVGVVDTQNSPLSIRVELVAPMNRVVLLVIPRLTVAVALASVRSVEQKTESSVISTSPTTVNMGTLVPARPSADAPVKVMVFDANRAPQSHSSVRRLLVPPSGIRRSRSLMKARSEASRGTLLLGGLRL